MVKGRDTHMELKECVCGFSGAFSLADTSEEVLAHGDNDFSRSQRRLECYLATF